MPDENEDNIIEDIKTILRQHAQEDGEFCRCNCGCEKDAETTDGRNTPLCFTCYRNC